MGENVVQFFNSAKEVTDALMNSPGHKYNTFYDKFEYAAIATYPSKKHPGHY